MSDRISEIRAREQAATPGPWRHGTGNREDFWMGKECVIGAGRVLLAFNSNFREDWETLGSFIAHSREDIPFLLAEVERLTAEVRRLNEIVAGYPNCFDDGEWTRPSREDYERARKDLGL